MHVVIPTVARSDFGRLKPVAALLDDYHFVVDCEHDFPSEVENSGFNVGLGTKGDIMMILGDRLEMLRYAESAIVQGMPIVHIGGGYVTAGSYDDQVRKALSVLSNIHCVANASCAAEVERLGMDNIHVTGAPDLDAVRLVPSLAREIDEDYLLVCVHPETLGRIKLTELVKVLDQREEKIVITHPCNDSGSEEIRNTLSRLDARQYTSVGHERYINLMRHAACVVGNSSSGIIEASFMGVPSVNIGTRQLGRKLGPSTVPCSWCRADINVSIQLAKQLSNEPSHIYGDGNAAEKIVACIE